VLSEHTSERRAIELERLLEQARRPQDEAVATSP